MKNNKINNYGLILFFLSLFSIIGCKEENNPNSNLSGDPCLEGNNSIDCPDELLIDVPRQEKIETKGDKDYFKFYVSKNSITDISVNPVPSEINMDVSLYNSEKGLEEQYLGINYGQSVYLSKLTKPGIYYIKCNDHLDDSSSNELYTILVTIDTSDIYEINNTFNQSTLINLYDTVQGKIRPSRDFDFFKFAIQQTGIIEINVNPVPESITMDCTLYDEHQVWITGTSSQTGQGVYFLALRSPGIYYLKLNDHGTATSNNYYRFFLSLDVTDIYEINNTFYTASSVNLHTYINAKVRPTGDRDFYKINLEQTGMYHVSINPVPAQICMSAYIFDSQYDIVFGRDYGSPGQTVNIDFNINSSGLYYLRLFDSYGISSSQFYTYIITKTNSK